MKLKNFWLYSKMKYYTSGYNQKINRYLNSLIIRLKLSRHFLNWISVLKPMLSIILDTGFMMFQLSEFFSDFFKQQNGDLVTENLRGKSIWHQDEGEGLHVCFSIWKLIKYRVSKGIFRKKCSFYWEQVDWVSVELMLF